MIDNMFTFSVSVPGCGAFNGRQMNLSINSNNSTFDINQLAAPRQTLKRRRTDDDLQRDRRSTSEEKIDFCLAGVNSRSHFRIRRSDPLWQSLDAFAERKGKQAQHLSLFYEGECVPIDSTPDDLGLFNGECLQVYEMVD